MDEKENKIYSDGYMKGFFTALEFVSKYCSDIKTSYNDVNDLIRRHIDNDTKNRKDEEREL